jgi:large subunit ribosomal protein L21
MYAIIKVAGRQYRVEKGQEVFLNRLEGEEGEKVTFDEVLLKDNEGKVEVGKPALNGAKVDAKILEQVKGDKVVVFKKKRRKGYQKKNGHRQQLTKVLIEGIK